MDTQLIILFIPLVVIWAAAAGASAVVGVVGRYYYKKNSQKKYKLGVLGMQGAGKTRFLSYLRNVPYVEKGTSKEPYESFTYKFEKKEILIDAGVDFGGGDLYRVEYNRIIKNSDVILYFFDIDRYLNEKSKTEEVSYRRACNSRIEHIHSADKEADIVFVATHIDLCKKVEEEVRLEFLKLIENKSYYSSLKDVELIDITNKDQLNRFIDKVF